MKAKRFNPKTREYEIIEVPEKACVICIDLDTEVQCASCRAELHYVDTVASTNIKTFGGFGFAICKQCAEREKQLAKESAIPLDRKN